MHSSADAPVEIQKVLFSKKIQNKRMRLNFLTRMKVTFEQTLDLKRRKRVTYQKGG